MSEIAVCRRKAEILKRLGEVQLYEQAKYNGWKLLRRGERFGIIDPSSRLTISFDLISRFVRRSARILSEYNKLTGANAFL